ncbi:ergosterol biosynthesis ERG4/ERG24 [Fimicolochytrium jonesii]|uniref:ergosterol biosynthesis ERG4/ERG24 n=1 Tax=Fimicolochytrium jonesii TaxID=1396493 RepID=UPI0022FDFEF3|nr:ergosterol biosynthesis ERG4/ERG24 [Fimicolochytrium jonesii]KAI8823965.1 ergosterol biosynthesis ERG4/ERG24 [Fimicolochytrium jonesii]
MAVTQRKRPQSDKLDVKPATSAQTGKTWGRARDVGSFTITCSAIIMATCPLMVVYFWMACTSFQCSLAAPFEKLTSRGFSLVALEHGLEDLVKDNFPTPTKEGFQLYFAWLLFQAALYAFLPGKIGYGQMTPAGYTLPYVVNGLLAWVVTHALFIGASLGLGLFPASIIHDHWGGLLIAANVYGYFLTIFSYLKAYIAPSHKEDRKFSGSIVYDMFMGIEFNPRLGKYFDFKLFHNGRPGIVAWTLINFSFAVAQWQRIGYVTNSMVLLNFLHWVYVIDFFINEDWYLRTIDIAHDHFGFYLSWGDSVWLPFMYTLQSHFLVRNPVDMSWPWFTFVSVLGLSGYYIFRAVNHQKDIVRRTDGHCKIWGRPAKVIRTEFITSDGKTHKSLLLCSGFWGLSRHFNYVGDLLISLAMCLTCGSGYLLPYFYIIYMTILLMQRVHRDHERCKGKYGKFWEEYCRVVPYAVIPYVF